MRGVGRRCSRRIVHFDVRALCELDNVSANRACRLRERTSREPIVLDLRRTRLRSSGRGRYAAAGV